MMTTTEIHVKIVIFSEGRQILQITYSVTLLMWIAHKRQAHRNIEKRFRGLCIYRKRWDITTMYIGFLWGWWAHSEIDCGERLITVSTQQTTRLHTVNEWTVWNMNYSPGEADAPKIQFYLSSAFGKDGVLFYSFKDFKNKLSLLVDSKSAVFLQRS